MALSVGIVGLPNVGKSTVFNALTHAQNAEAANYPFCTIEANKAIVPVPDDRVDRIAAIDRPARVVHATVEFVDIAGLVRGASKGEGLGNQFLANIRDVDAIMHVVRCFDDADIVHVEGAVDPDRDIEIVERELVVSDVERLENKLGKLTKLARADKSVRDLHTAAQDLLAHVVDGHSVRSHPERGVEPLRSFCHEMQFLTDKRVIYCANVDETGAGEPNAYIDAVRRTAAERDAPAVIVSARIEEELGDLSGEDRAEFLASYGLEQDSLDTVVDTAYGVLGLLTFFTVNENEAHAWHVRSGTHAPAAAGVIHTDFERGFIRAQVIHFGDYMEHGGSAGCKAVGAMRQEGKDYAVCDGDVIFFVFSV